MFVSGFLPGDDEVYRVVPPETPMLQKPWRPDDLLRVIGAALRR